MSSPLRPLLGHGHGISKLPSMAVPGVQMTTAWGRGRECPISKEKCPNLQRMTYIQGVVCHPQTEAECRSPQRKCTYRGD